jgi:nitrogen fixation/metabolism regulation signal transduction histidine kinase
MKRWGPGRLFVKLYGGFLAVALTGLVFAEVLVDRRVQTMERTQVEERLSYIATMLGQMSAEALFGPVDASDASLSGDISDVARAVHTQLFLLTAAGRVVIDSDDAGRPPSQELAMVRDDGEKPEIAQARTGAVGIAVRGVGVDRKIYVARSIVRHGQLLGFARAAFPMNVVEASIVAVRLRFAIGAAAAVGLALTLGLFISFRIMRPVKALAEGARRIGAGDYEQHIETGSKDELADLARAFNDMARDLRAAMQQLGRRNRDLRLVLDNVDQGFVTADLGGQLS